MDAGKVLQLKELKNALKHYQDIVKDIESNKRNLEAEIMDDLDSDGSSLTRTKHGTVSITKEEVAQVIDWPTAEAYMIENNALYLFQRRLSNPAWRDECTSKGLMPGTESFTKRKLSFTNKTT